MKKSNEQIGALPLPISDYGVREVDELPGSPKPPPARQQIEETIERIDENLQKVSESDHPECAEVFKEVVTHLRGQKSGLECALRAMEGMRGEGGAAATDILESASLLTDDLKEEIVAMVFDPAMEKASVVAIWERLRRKHGALLPARCLTYYAELKECERAAV